VSSRKAGAYLILLPSNLEVPPMIVFNVKDMTCNHCSGSITRAVLLLDPAATVLIDLAAQSVEVHPAASDAVALGAAIAEAGYTPVLHSARA
jgi:copper chaperone